MENFKGTKGKWKIRPTQAKNENGKPLFYDIVVDGSCFISTHKNQYINVCDKEQLANAKLIACAPCMLKELQLIFETYDKGTDTYKRLELLINKATNLNK